LKSCRAISDLAPSVKVDVLFRKQFSEVEDACALAQAMVDTVREPLIVLDKDLRVVAASRSFYVKFTTDPDDTHGKHFYELGGGEWDIPQLRLLLEKIIPDHGAMDEYEVEHEFPRLGRRVMLLNARIVRYAKAHTNILLGIEDITIQRDHEREKDDLLRQKGVLLDEVQHRVANSLQIIASIIMMKALSVESEETRRHLEDAHHRVISVAAVQQHLHASAGVGLIEMQPYLSQLCDALAHAMIGEHQSISLKVISKGGSATSRDAESLGLIVTELAINSLKHAFNAKTKNGQISVAYEVSGTDWKLTVADNGIGRPDRVFAQPKSGLGTGIVKALAKQLDSHVVTSSGPKGTTVSVTHATFAGREAQTSPVAA
jgi:two-component sensor histidine kinase